MSKRRHYRQLADAERRAAQFAQSAAACRIHIERARAFDWKADAEPYPDEEAAAPDEAVTGKAPR